MVINFTKVKIIFNTVRNFRFVCAKIKVTSQLGDLKYMYGIRQIDSTRQMDRQTDRWIA